MTNELRQQAIRLLARREHTRVELARKLADFGTREEIDAVLADMEASQLQSDNRTAENYLRSNASRLGASRLRHTLKSRGVAPETIDEQLAQADLPDELERARAAWSRKFSAAPANPKEWARQARFLQSRGFAGDIVRRLLKQPLEGRMKTTDPGQLPLGYESRAPQPEVAAAPAAATLSAHNLRKKYKKQTVVTDVSFEVEAGEVVGLLGPNGAGKTTCFYMIVGLVAADGGEIRIENEGEHQRLTHMPIHQRAKLGLSYLPQENSVFRKLTVSENVRAVLELQGLDEGAIDEREEALLQELHITHIRKNLAASLSGGERRRVEIARALATRPRFILLDEPFAGVDPIAVIDIQKIIRYLRDSGIGVLITDHNVRETLGICDRATIINAGEVLAAGHPAEIVDNESVRRVYLGEHFRM
jgi:lipopolysaccharide export system ATP-binding protein